MITLTVEYDHEGNPLWLSQESLIASGFLRKEGTDNQPRATYSFPGLTPFVKRMCQLLGKKVTPELSQRALNGWHATSIQNILGQLPQIVCNSRNGRAPVQSSVDTLNRVIEVRESLAMTLAGIDLAIDEVCEQLDIPRPEYSHGTRYIQSDLHTEDDSKYASVDRKRNDMASIQNRRDKRSPR